MPFNGKDPSGLYLLVGIVGSSIFILTLCNVEVIYDKVMSLG